MRDRDDEGQQEEGERLHEKRAQRHAPGAPELREKPIARDGVRGRGELLDGEDGSTGDHENEADVDGKVRDHARGHLTALEGSRARPVEVEAVLAIGIGRGRELLGLREELRVARLRVHGIIQVNDGVCQLSSLNEAIGNDDDVKP